MIEASVIVPARNEAGHIEACLESILSGDYPGDRLEVIVVDGHSGDGTAEIVRRFAERHGNVRVVPNPDLYTPHAINRGIAVARGEFILVLGAHARYPRDYVSTLVQHVRQDEGDFVGGGLDCEPGATGVIAEAISIALGSPVGVGVSFRTRRSRVPLAADTAVFGCARRALLFDVGLYDTAFIRAQDLELCVRLRRMGKRVILLPWLRATYFARDTFGKLSRMEFQYGYWKNMVNARHRLISSVRQLAPPALVLALAASVVGSAVGVPRLPLSVMPVAIYSGFILAAAALESAAAGKPRTWLAVAWAFAVMHLSYGWGYLRGLWDVVVRRKAPTGGSLSGMTR